MLSRLQRPRVGVLFLLAGAAIMIGLLLTGNLGKFIEPSASAATGNDPGPGPCLPAKSFLGADGPQRAADWLEGKDPRDPHTHPTAAQRTGVWIAQHADWTQPQAGFDPNSLASVADYFRNHLHAQQITQPLNMQNHWCNPSHGGQIESVSNPAGVSGDWIWYTDGGHAAKKAACGNELTPFPPKPAPVTPHQAPKQKPAKPCNCFIPPPVVCNTCSPPPPIHIVCCNEQPPPPVCSQCAPPPPPPKCPSSGTCGTPTSGPEQNQRSDPGRTNGYNSGSAENNQASQPTSSSNYSPTPNGTDSGCSNCAPSGQTSGPSGNESGGNQGTSNSQNTEGSGQTSSGDPGAP